MSETVTPDPFNPPCHKLSTAVQNDLDLLLQEYESQFAKDKTTIGTTPLTSMTIDTGTSDPVLQKPSPITMEYYQWVKDKIEKLSNGNGGKHLVIDYRALNKVTRKFTWSMPKVEDIFSKLNGATYFTTLGL